MFTRVKHIKVEVDKGTQLPPLSNDLKESLRTLSHNPAFQYLITRLKLERAGLKHQLENGFTLNETQLKFLQAGIHYSGWLEDTISRLTHTPRPAVHEATADEQELFNQHLAALEVIE